MTLQPLRLVIFDCDGVLVDSEPASRRVLAAEAARLGWAITETDVRGFTGLRWSDLQPVFEHGAGAVLPRTWPLHMQALLLAELAGNVTAIDGAAPALLATAALGLPYRVASNSSHDEMAAKFAATGLAGLVAGRTHSAKDVGVGKPAPDLFLAAAAAEGVHPAHCLVVEDSRPGVTAALAAGMRCVLYAPDGDPENIARDGMDTIARLGELPVLLRQALSRKAA